MALGNLFSLEGIADTNLQIIVKLVGHVLAKTYGKLWFATGVQERLKHGNSQGFAPFKTCV